jgi:transitional endoplasmic reticulum ATPase
MPKSTEQSGPTAHSIGEQRTLATLRELGKGKVIEDAIKRGPHIVLPTTMSVREAIQFLIDHEKAHEKVHRYSRTFRYRPWDVAVAFERAVKILTGAGGIGMAQPATFFSPEVPPERRTVKIGPGANDTIEVPWGEIVVPMISAKVYTGGKHDEDLGPLGHITVDAPKKYAAEVEGLFALIADELAKGSIYRGKAITAAGDPDFLDLSSLDAEKIVYATQTWADLNAHVLAVINHAATLQDLGEPTKRAVLLEGPYGTGKTSALMIVAQAAERVGWTTVHVRPGKDNPFEALQTAKLYADDKRGAVVLIEDVDTFSSESDPDAVTRLLDAFDGIEAKGAPIIALLTTNHPDRIHKGMLRPGRLDAVIHVGDLDGGGVLRLIRATIDAERLAPSLADDEHFESSALVLGEHGEGMPPAFVREAISRAVRYAVVREDGNRPEVLTLDDFTVALDSLRPQLALMTDAAEGRTPDPLAVSLDRVVRHAVEQSQIIVSEGAYDGVKSDEKRGNRGFGMAARDSETKPAPVGADL